jgi:hypothetical protein
VSAPNVLAGATDLPRLLPAVVAAAEAAGRLLAAEFARPGGPRGAGSHADIDHEIEVGLRQRLLELLPACWMGEKTGADPGPGGAELAHSVRDWAMRQGWGGQPVAPPEAQGMLGATLGVRAAHFQWMRRDQAA